MTKKQQAIYNAYLSAYKSDLDECYDRPSSEKKAAYRKCSMRMSDMCGSGFKILSHNVYMFTIAFTYSKDGKKYLHYESNKSKLDFAI